VTHYKGKLYCWDVVNEVLEEDGTIRKSIWSKNFGTSFIEEAFRTAHSTDPEVKLYINEYGTEGHNKKSDGLYNLVKQMKADGVPVHGVGFQAHFIVDEVPNDLQSNLQRFADLGLDVAITELDLRLKLPVTPASLERQARDYVKVFNACLAVERCVGVTVWGYTDKYSWIPGFFQGFGAANLFDEKYQPKPAVSAIEKILL
jgi:endo-1,4-beta-xylanase